jgi:type II secretory pathway pseudopilin PulG
MRTRRTAPDRPSTSEAGFTLIEVVIAFAIAAGTIVLGVSLYRIVGVATQSGRTAERDWVTEQFLRGQVEAADAGSMIRFALGRERAREFGFVTRRSAQWGASGPPVLAIWRYDSDDATLRYHEAQVAPWWPEDRPPADLDYEEMAVRTHPNVWDGQIFSDIASLQFGYWDERTKNWTPESPDPSHLAPIVRLAVVHVDGSERTFVFATSEASSFSSHSGSSQGAQ